MDAFDLFSDRPTTYSGSLWLFQSTKGVYVPGGHYDTVEEAEAALATAAKLELSWTHEFIEDGITTFASTVYGRNMNVAVITRLETGDVHSHAPIVDGWVPDWHPSRS